MVSYQVVGSSNLSGRATPLLIGHMVCIGGSAAGSAEIFLSVHVAVENQTYIALWTGSTDSGVVFCSEYP